MRPCPWKREGKIQTLKTVETNLVYRGGAWPSSVSRCSRLAVKISKILNIRRGCSGLVPGPIGYIVHDDDTRLVGISPGTGGKNAVPGCLSLE